ncbi:hypothetical protein ATANTOWER_004327 [Ataeniobius toweri]|uniref:Secreted protein n=1 Tax=Ataeniobius toweri TaxID=208326 RepID=A0ABU7BIG5_9TELE|nr:hypothetical protein [Ataeniobius toweri]
MLAWIMALLTAYEPICDAFCWVKKNTVRVGLRELWVCGRRGGRMANLLDLLRSSYIDSCPVNDCMICAWKMNMQKTQFPYLSNILTLWDFMCQTNTNNVHNR